MVGKLNDVMTAAVVLDSTPKTSSSETKSDSLLKSAETQNASVSATKSQDVQTKPGEEKEKGLHLEPGTMSEESVLKMTETFNKLMSKINVNLEFTYNKEADMFTVKMIDKETKEVLREFPPEEMIENMIKTRDWLGAFIDKTV